MLVGHNDRIAWGLSNLQADVTDFFLERTAGQTYLRDGRQVPLEEREEVIRVAGGQDRRVQVRSTVHGPLLSDAVTQVRAAGRAAPVPEGSPLEPAGYDVALAWTALTPGRSADAVFALGAARDWEEFGAALEQLEVPALNFVYADVEGHIGYQAAGAIPVRRSTGRLPVPEDGRWPRPGWESVFDWQGLLPAASLPSVLDPAAGFVVAANQAVTPAAGVQLTRDPDRGYRAHRIRSVLEGAAAAGRQLSPQDMRDLQTDTRNAFAGEVLVPALLSVPVGSFTGEARELLEDWDGDQAQDSAAAAYYNAVWSNLLRLTFHDELGQDARPDGGSRWYEVVRALLEEPQNAWWDDRGTPNIVETRDEILTQALDEARLELTRTLGKDPSRWQWGRLHRLELRQQPLGDSAAPALVQDLMNSDLLELGGGTAAVLATAWSAREAENYTVTAVPSLRMVVDLADLDASTWVDLTGVSGHPASGHYLDQLPTWADGETYPWPFTETAVREASGDELVLRPQAATG